MEKDDLLITRAKNISKVEIPNDGSKQERMSRFMKIHSDKNNGATSMTTKPEKKIVRSAMTVANHEEYEKHCKELHDDRQTALAMMISGSKLHKNTMELNNKLHEELVKVHEAYSLYKAKYAKEQRTSNKWLNTSIALSLALVVTLTLVAFG